MASRYPSFKLVTEPNDSTSTVLFDLNDKAPSGGAAPREVLSEEFSLGAPALEGDPDAIDPLYGPREITLKLEIKGDKAQATALMSSLARVLLTGYTGGFIPGLWLRVQVTAATTPVWFRLLRPSPGDVAWDNVYTESGATATDRWYIDLTLPAEAFGYGAKETVAAQTVNHDPTSGTNPCRVLLPTIKGDAPTPLRVRLVSASFPPDTAPTGYLAVLSTSQGLFLPLNIPVGTGDGLTAGTDTSAAAAGANTVGGSYRDITFATNQTMVDRLSGTTLPTNPGRYKVFARVTLATGGPCLLRMTLNGVVGSTVSCEYSGLGYRMVDLGDFTFPMRVPVQPADVGPTSSPSFVLAASRAGGGTVSVDHLLLVPVNVPYMVDSRAVYATLSASTTQTNVVDGETGDAWTYNTALQTLQPTGGALSGVMPRVTPGANNALHLITQVDPNVGGHIVASSTSVTCIYYPRYLNVPDT